MPHAKSDSSFLVGGMVLKYLKYCGLIGVLFSGHVSAQDSAETQITVLANGGWLRVDEAGQALTIIGADEIAEVQGADITRILERAPGISITRNGGPGSFTAVRLRGAEVQQLLVLVDGVRVADAASPAGGFDFGTLLPGGIGKIEILRGSNSTIWGSDAMAGVLALQSRALHGVEASLEYGGPQSIYGQLSAGLPILDDGSEISFSASLIDSAGISSAADGIELDGLRQWQMGGLAEIGLTDGLALKAAIRHSDARLELDGFPAPDYQLSDTDEYQNTQVSSGSAGLEYFGDAIELQGSFSLSDTARENYDPVSGTAPTYTTSGRREHLDLRGKWSFAQNLDLRFGGSRDWSHFSTLFDTQKNTSSFGAYSQLGFVGEAVRLNAGLRIDDHQGFGSAWSFGADGQIRLDDDWRLRASYGEGFKAPSLFQRLSDYGNGALRPERSRSFDLGIERGDRNGPFHLALSAFRRDSRDLIDFIFCLGISDGICADRPFGTYDNVGKARAQGVEAEAALMPTEQLRLRGAYSYVEAQNLTAGAANEGNNLARRPRHMLTLSADWTESRSKLHLGADLRAVSGSFDDGANLVPLDGYSVVTLRASLPLSEQVALFGRIENVLDVQYQTAAGYGTPGRGAYIGARASF